MKYTIIAIAVTVLWGLAKLRCKMLMKIDPLTSEYFELIILRDYLLSKTESHIKVLMILNSKGSKLQIPLSAKSSAKETWLNLKYDLKGK